MNLRSRTSAIVLIVVGTLFLLSNLGVVPQLGPLLRQWWPLILIVIGVIMLVQRS
jgi:LiaI-LiaF-like transmembrane region